MKLLLKKTRVHDLWVRVFCFLIIAFGTTAAFAQQDSGGFRGGVTPSRFELKAKPGEVIKQSLAIYNLGGRPEEYTVLTNDWTYSADGAIGFSRKLLKDSCRQWVKLERHELKVLPSGQRPRNFRFEVHVPESAEPRECRFAIMIGTKAKPHVNNIGGQISLPSTGKVGVIVYLAIGDVNSDTQVESYTIQDVKGRLLPAVKVKNYGLAHGRLDSELQATDRAGKKFRLSVSNTPIMPGQTRVLAMSPTDTELEHAIVFPISIKGRIFTKTRTIVVNEANVGR